MNVVPIVAGHLGNALEVTVTSHVGDDGLDDKQSLNHVQSGPPACDNISHHSEWLLLGCLMLLTLSTITALNLRVENLKTVNFLHH